MLYSYKTDTIYSKCKQNLFQLWGRHTMSSPERGEKI